MTMLQVMLTFLGIVGGFCAVLMGYLGPGIPLSVRAVLCIVGCVSMFLAYVFAQMLGDISKLQQKLEEERTRYFDSQNVVHYLGWAVRKYMSQEGVRNYLSSYVTIYWGRRRAYIDSICPTQPEGDAGLRAAMADAHQSVDAAWKALMIAGVQPDLYAIYASTSPADMPESAKSSSDTVMREKLDNVRSAVADLNSLSDQP